ISSLTLMNTQRWTEAEAEFATALELDPNNADAWAMRSELMVVSGRPAEAIADIEKALRLNPHPPGWYYWYLGQAQYCMANTSEPSGVSEGKKPIVPSRDGPWRPASRSSDGWTKHAGKQSCSWRAIR